MSRLGELIQRYCPLGVSFLELSQVADIVRGERITKRDLVEYGEYPVMSGGVSYMGRYSKNNRDANTITISSYGAAGYVGFITEDFWANDVCLCVYPHNENVLNKKYLYYCLKSLQEYIYGNTTKAIPDHIPTSFLKELRIPVPPFEIQAEIVRILDNFTELTAKLTAELTARKKQYEYYRDTVLDFNGKYNMVKLKDIAIDFFRGSGIKREEVTQEGTPCVRYGEIYTTYNTQFDTCVSHTNPENLSSPRYFEYGDILFAITGESVEDIAKSIAYVGHDRCLAGGDIIVMKHKQNPKFLAHALSTEHARKQKSKGKVKSKVVHSNVSSIENIEIPLPPLDIQEKCARMLDKFESICNDMSFGLPAEVEARKKQYEYYRDKLLCFKEKESIN